jgi:hypothetical protein
MQTVLMILLCCWMLSRIRFWGEAQGCLGCGAKRPDMHSPICPFKERR